MSPTFVLVHGAFANSFSFAPLQAELALLGHRSAALDLPGHGFAATYPPRTGPRRTRRASRRPPAASRA